MQHDFPAALQMHILLAYLLHVEFDTGSSSQGNILYRGNGLAQGIHLHCCTETSSDREVGIYHRGTRLAYLWNGMLAGCDVWLMRLSEEDFQIVYFYHGNM